MSTHKVCFYGEITKIIPKLSSNTLFNCSTDLGIIFHILHKNPPYLSQVMRKLFIPYVNNKDADQPVQSDQHLCCSLRR